MDHAATLSHPIDFERPVGVNKGKLGMWLFLCSEVMFFSGLIGSYLVLRMGTLDWPQPGQVLNIPLTGLNTFILICSSVTMVKAFYWCHEGNKKKITLHLFLTFLFGVIFLSIQAVEYYKLAQHGIAQMDSAAVLKIFGPDYVKLHGHGLVPSGNIYGTCFYVLTCFHGCHVFGGVIAVFIILVKSFFGHFTREHHAPVENVGLYWHFVDLVWIILFTIVYLI
jgi:heme/copper-type cytochrome/quinol oxidase subunit 3